MSASSRHAAYLKNRKQVDFGELKTVYSVPLRDMPAGAPVVASFSLFFAAFPLLFGRYVLGLDGGMSHSGSVSS